MIKNIKNISNYFSYVDIENVGSQLKQLLEKTDEYISGVEILGKEGVTEVLLVTPPHLRIEPNNVLSHREPITDEFTIYEGYLSRPHFLTLYGALNGEFLDEMKNLIEQINLNEIIWMQWLFRKAYNWKDTTLNMYASYLEGNDYPSSSSLGRLLQDKILQVLNKISSFQMTRDYIDETEQKIVGEGFQFQLRVAIKSENSVLIKNHIEEIFKRYDSYNAIRLFKVKNKKIKHYINECVLTADTKYQIVSLNEILSLFGSNTFIFAQGTETTKTLVAHQYTNFNRRIPLDLIQLLPKYSYSLKKLEAGKERDISILQDIAEALKRVGITKQARLYNETITEGVRLTVVQCDIPKGRNLTHITNKAKDIQAVLGVSSLGVEQGDKPDTVKFTLPNKSKSPTIICLRELLELESFHEFAKENPLAFIVGVDEINNPLFLSLTKLVHLLVAGTTGSGKSVFLNSLAVTLLITHTPEELKMIMIDPKQVELQQYTNFPHVAEVVTDMDEAVRVLEGLTKEMEDRYTLFKDVGVKNIELYNKKVSSSRAQKLPVPLPASLPYIVCIIDEYADLRDTNAEVEEYIARLGQKARAAGIHLVIATQRPDVKVISGRIKANIPNAISFNLNTGVNYRTVFGTTIPYSQLLGKGDGVMKIEGYPKEFQRFQSPIISPDESQEEGVYKCLSKALGGSVLKDNLKQDEILSEELKPHSEPLNAFNDNLTKLKKIIADTGETKVAPLRDKLGVKTTTMTELMTKLVEEGWLKKHDSKTKGYELILPDDELAKWKSVN